MRLGLAIAALIAVFASSAQSACRQALALALDVSGSVDLREYRLQLDGVITALNDPDVMAILLSQPQTPVSISVYEWSGPGDQAVIIPWTDIKDATSLDQISTTLALTNRRTSTPGTALGDAMSFGATLMQQRSDCWKRTIDISGDGKSNLGPRPRHVKSRLSSQGIVVNALVIGADVQNATDRRQVGIGELSSYFRAEVIVGPDAFVVTSLGFEAYADAMINKLKRELDGLVLSNLDHRP